MEEKYIQEVKKHLREKIEIRLGTKFYRTVLFVSWAIVNVAAYFVVRHYWEAQTALHDIVISSIVSILVNFFAFCALVINWRFYEVPEEIYNKQLQNIKSQNNEIKSQKEALDYHEELRRLFDDNLLSIDKFEDDKWVGIEIFNGEIKEFQGYIIITDIGDLGNLVNPIYLEKKNEYRNSNLYITHNSRNTVQLAHLMMNGEECVIGDYNTTGIKVPSGLHIVRTQLNGKFDGYQMTSPKDVEWELLFDKENKKVSLKKRDLNAIEKHLPKRA